MLIAAVATPLRIGAFAERQDAAVLAEPVFDDVFVEGVGRELRLTRELHLLARHEPQQRAALRADGAVAGDRAGDFAFDFDGDLAAMTATAIFHVRCSPVREDWRRARAASGRPSLRNTDNVWPARFTVTPPGGVTSTLSRVHMYAWSPEIWISWISLRPSILASRRRWQRLHRRGEFLFAEGLLPGDQEHHVVGHQGEHGRDVAGLRGRHPGGDELADLLFVGGHAAILLRSCAGFSSVSGGRHDRGSRRPSCRGAAAREHDVTAVQRRLARHRCICSRISFCHCW